VRNRHPQYIVSRPICQQSFCAICSSKLYWKLSHIWQPHVIDCRSSAYLLEPSHPQSSPLRQMVHCTTVFWQIRLEIWRPFRNNVSLEDGNTNSNIKLSLITAAKIKRNTIVYYPHIFTLVYFHLWECCSLWLIPQCRTDQSAFGVLPFSAIRFAVWVDYHSPKRLPIMGMFCCCTLFLTLPVTPNLGVDQLAHRRVDPPPQ